jgi:hypothetical protein
VGQHSDSPGSPQQDIGWPVILVACTVIVMIDIGDFGAAGISVILSMQTIATTAVIAAMMMDFIIVPQEPG